MATTKQQTKSEALFHRGEHVLVGGVDSPVRAFRAVGGDPIVVERASGSRIYDVDGREYIDYVSSWGAMIVGHADPDVTAAIQAQALFGTSYGMTSPLEIELAEQISRAMPSMEMIRFVSSGTEATMSAIRLARASTNRDFILKFEGCYHGHSDSFLSEAGSGLATLGISACPGVPEAFANLTLNVPYNDFPAVEKAFATHSGKIAAIIVEPVAANMGVVLPAPSFLQNLRTITRKEGALLIFDEVISGFRLALGGAQAIYNIEPDLTTIGKIIGGGLPVAAYGGKREIMQRVAPLGPVYQAGTLSGNPLAMRAGLAVLSKLRNPAVYDDLNQKGKRLADGLHQACAGANISAQINQVGSLLTLFFARDPKPIRSYDDAKRCDKSLFAKFFHEMLRRGVFLPPSQFEALFISTNHTDADLNQTVQAARDSLQAMKS